MAKPQIPKSTWQKARKFFNDVHLWLGLASGLIVILICFSGAAYVYNTEITEMAAPHLYKVQNMPAGSIKISPDSLIKKVELASGGTIASIHIMADEKRTYQFNVKKEGDKSRFGTAYFVDPYTGNITGNSNEKNGTKKFMGNMFSLHRWLLLDKIDKPIISGVENKKLGSTITGWATILFTLGCITGLIIWFPQKIKNWKQGLKIKLNANWKRVNHDLHNTLAFYAFIFLLVMGLTGPQWSFEWYRTSLQKTLGTYKPDGKKSENEAKGKKQNGVENNNAMVVAPTLKSIDSAIEVNRPQSYTNLLPVSSYLAVADKELPYTGNYIINFPEERGEPVSIHKTKTGFFAPAAADKLILNPQTAEKTKLEIFSKKPFNERVAGSIKALHVGNVYGGFTKLLYFLACFIATTLPVTGTLIWLNKLKKKKSD